jgi:hypothetical protein
MKTSLILAGWTLQRLHSERLPGIATDWLMAGYDSPALRELAGIATPIMSEAGPVFERVLAELAWKVPAKDEALLIVAHDAAQGIVEGAIPPYEGARIIWWGVANELEHPSQLLLDFVGAASELEDIPERSAHDGLDRQNYILEMEATIRSSARKLLEQTTPEALRRKSSS